MNTTYLNPTTTTDADELDEPVWLVADDVRQYRWREAHRLSDGCIPREDLTELLATKGVAGLSESLSELAWHGRYWAAREAVLWLAQLDYLTDADECALLANLDEADALNNLPEPPDEWVSVDEEMEARIAGAEAVLGIETDRPTGFALDMTAALRPGYELLRRQAAAFTRADELAMAATGAEIRALPVTTHARSSLRTSRPARRTRDQAARSPDDPSRPRQVGEADLRRALEDSRFLLGLEPDSDGWRPERRWAWCLEYLRNRLGLAGRIKPPVTLSRCSPARSKIEIESECSCGCGPFVPRRPNQSHASAACRKRAERKRNSGA